MLSTLTLTNDHSKTHTHTNRIIHRFYLMLTILHTLYSSAEIVVCLNEYKDKQSVWKWF